MTPLSNSTRPQRAWPKTMGWVVILLLALLMTVLASRYLTLNPDVYFPQQRAVYLANTLSLLAHVLGSMLATLIGPFQFLPKIRTGRFLNLHRWLGRIYLLGVLVGGLGGLHLATMAYGGLPTRAGFMALGGLWLFTGVMAYWRIRNKEVQSHRQWMVRNYALTFAAVTLRLWQIVFGVAGLDFLTGYTIVAWLSWMPNLLVAEWMVSRLRARPHLAPAA